MTTPSTDATNSDWKWSLRDMLVATVMIAVFFAIANYVGFGQPLLWICTIASAIIAVVCATSIPYKRFVSPWVMTALIMFFLCNPLFMFFSPVMAINGIFHLLFASVAKRFLTPLTVKRVLAVSFSLTLVSFSIGVLISLPRYYEVELAKERFRPVDLSQRLSYEEQMSPSQPIKKATRPITQNSLLEATIADWTRSSDIFRGRVSELRSLHNGRVDSFARSPGFGVGRFFAPNVKRIEYPETQDLPFTVVADDEFEEMIQSVREFRFGLPKVDSYQKLHTGSVLAFANPAATGLITEPKVAAGFQPHAMKLPPQNLAKDFLTKQQLTLDSLQLISLHRFDSPRAYVLDHLPRMDQLIGEDVPTRKLSHFERSAIETLRQTGTQDIVTEVTDDGITMLGSVRAYESCLECHSVNKGDLLGAFSYTFREISGANNLNKSELGTGKAQAH